MKKTLFVLVMFSMLSVSSFAQAKKQKAAPKKAVTDTTAKPSDKVFPVALTLQEWYAVEMSIASPDDVSANTKKYLRTRMAEQVNKQIADTTGNK